MSKLTIEIDVPDWVNWIAVDEGGRVDGYEDKPVKGGYYWFSNAGKADKLYQGMPPKNWKTELYTWR